jgi:hypothetical protein
MIDEKTFGKTPAAMYLARELNSVGDQSLIRSCSVRTKMFNQNVKDIEQAVSYGLMSSKTGANLLLLLRHQASVITIDDLSSDVNAPVFIAQLLRNTIIGNIKQAIRRISIVRKIEINSVDEFKIMRSGRLSRSSSAGAEVFEVLGHEAGIITSKGEYWKVDVNLNSIADTTTPELLHERSDRRCKRLGKEHMIGK